MTTQTDGGTCEMTAGCEVVAVCVPDNVGRLVGKRVSIEKWGSVAKHGLAMPNFHLVTGVENVPATDLDVTGTHTGFPNGRLVPTRETLCRPPWEPATAFVICDVERIDGSRVEEAPRTILAQQVQRLKDLGLEARCASELEFYVFARPLDELAASGFARLPPSWHRHGDNDVLVSGFDEDFIGAVRHSMSAIGIDIEVAQGEGGPGQHELNLSPHGPLRAADQHVLYKHGVKALAHQVGLSVTFMAKPSVEWAGSSGHVHISLQDGNGSAALGGDDLSELGRSFLAGMLAFSPELALMHAPYANSYRRLRPGSFAPANTTWGWDNRSCMVRVVTQSPGIRFEFRVPGADTNPYHAYSALIAAGLAGVERNLVPPLPIQGDAYADPGAKHLPRDLTEAIQMFESSEVAQEAFGPTIHRHLSMLGQRELDASRRAVTDWDRQRCFEPA